MTDPAPAEKRPETAILERIKAYLEASGTAESAFGRDVCGDVNLVATMGKGRNIRLSTAQKIEAELAAGWARIKAKAPPELFQFTGSTDTKAAE